MDKPLIGVLPLVDIARESYWMLPGYMRGIEQAGGLPVMLPLTADKADIGRMAVMFDGFLFTGGQDVSPAVYHEEKRAECGECCAERDAMELSLLEQALALDKPVFGICRGIQLLNAALGGTLYQDLPAQNPSGVNHHQSPPYDIPVHVVELVQGSALQRLLEKDRLLVNSYHHQAVRALAPALVPMAYASDGLIEAVCLPGKRFVWAVQWHPEFSYRTDEDSRRILRAFVEQAGRSISVL